MTHPNNNNKALIKINTNKLKATINTNLGNLKQNSLKCIIIKLLYYYTEDITEFGLSL